VQHVTEPSDQINPLKLAFSIALLRSGVRTIDRLSVLTKIERSRLSRISNGLIQPTDTERHTIARALGVDVGELFR
jgi:hypothetical protein